jgi:hypothetical protein
MDRAEMLRISGDPSLNPPGLTRGSTNSFTLFVDGRIKSGQGDEGGDSIQANTALNFCCNFRGHNPRGHQTRTGTIGGRSAPT